MSADEARVERLPEVGIAFVGCGYVFDIYMRTTWAYPELVVRGVYDIDTSRSAVVHQYYGFAVYPSYDALLSDESVDIVVNLTSISSHYSVVHQALEAGKHVYSEKPVTTDLEATRELFALAERRGVVLGAAPCNVFSDAVATVWKAVRDGAVGKPVLVYAELDDNPAHLMGLEAVRSPTGAPFPFAEELQQGCTFEHIGYHLVWLCALFGPVQSLTAYSSTLIEVKTTTPLDPPDTPDLSVACLSFAGGVSARVTCSWVSPRDHSIRVVGDAGQLTVDNVFHDQSPVHLERFSRVSLTARKARTLRTQPVLGRLFNLGGRRLELVRRWRSHAVEAEKGVGRSPKHRFVSWLRRREIHALDKMLGVAEMARAIHQGRPQPLPADFLVHLNELTLLVQRAGPTGVSVVPETSFECFDPLPDVSSAPQDYAAAHRPRLSERLLSRVVGSLQS